MSGRQEFGFGAGRLGGCRKVVEAALWSPLQCDCGGGWTRAWDALGSAWNMLGGA